MCCSQTWYRAAVLVRRGKHAALLTPHGRQTLTQESQSGTNWLPRVWAAAASLQPAACAGAGPPAAVWSMISTNWTTTSSLRSQTDIKEQCVCVCVCVCGETMLTTHCVSYLPGAESPASCSALSAALRAEPLLRSRGAGNINIQAFQFHFYLQKHQFKSYLKHFMDLLLGFVCLFLLIFYNCFHIYLVLIF